MNVQISSEKIDNPLLIELLKTLVVCFDKLAVPFYVIGATARDIILRHLIDIASQRKTYDLDIAIAIPDWEKFDEVSKSLQAAGLKKSTYQRQRFYFNEFYGLDIVPFGGVAKEDEKIYWQPDEDIAMSVKGFDIALQEAITVNIDGKFEIQMVSLQGLFLLKLNAWSDRPVQKDKDADDMALILENYLEINQQRAIENYYDEIYNVKNFDTFVAGATLLGKDLWRLFQENKSALNYFAEMLQNEMLQNEESRLLNQILETHNSLHYNQVYNALNCLYNEIKQECSTRTYQPALRRVI